MRVQSMKRVDPGCGIREARGIELVRTPRIDRPVLPVLHDVVEGNLPPPELPDHIQRLPGGFIALPRLPQAKGPVWQHRCLAGEQTITGNHLVGRRAIHEVIINAIAHLRP